MRALTRLAAVAGIGLLVLFGLLLAVLPGQGEPRERSVFSAKDAGWRALYLALEGLGFPVQAWSRTPSELVGPGTLLVLAETPAPPPALPASLARAEPGAAPRRGRDLAHYRAFVEAGGTLLVLGVDAEELATLRDELGLTELAPVVFEEGELEPQELLLPGERLAYRGPFAGTLSAPDAEALVRTPDGRALALRVRAGAGQVALLALAPERLDNEALRGEPAALLLLVRLFEALGPREHVLFDEYALGAWRPPAALALAFGPRAFLLSAHLLLLLALFVWRSAWSGPFARDPVPLRAASPLARARGYGRLLARAGRFELLAAHLRRGLLARWEARAGGRTAPADDEPERLRRIARGDERLRARLAALFALRPASEAELVRLASDLHALESSLLPPPEKSPPAAGARLAWTRS